MILPPGMYTVDNRLAASRSTSEPMSTPSAGAARGGDTYLITEQGPRLITPTEVWPLKRIRVQGAEFVHPDILQR